MEEAVITGVVAIIVCMINNYFTQKQAEKKHDATIALIEYKLEEMSNRVDKHNNVIERTYKLEEAATLYDEKFRVVNHRLAELASAEKKG